MGRIVTPNEVSAFVDGFLDGAQHDRQVKDPDEYAAGIAWDERGDLFEHQARYGYIQDAYSTGVEWYGEFAAQIDLEQGGGSGSMPEEVKRVVAKFCVRAALRWAKDVEADYPRFAGGGGRVVEMGPVVVKDGDGNVVG